MNNKVSIVMPCYNSEKYISEAIDSILQQTYANWELIIVDDGSTDGSKNIINKFKQRDERIKVLLNKENKGVSAARNLGIRNCSGQYIAFLDSDDIARAKRLETEVRFLETNKKYGAVGSQVQVIDLESHIIGKSSLPVTWADLRKIMFFKNPFICSSMMVRKSIIEKYQISFDEHIKIGEDFLFWIELSRYCNILVLKDYLAAYRLNTGGIAHKWKIRLKIENNCCESYKKIYLKLWKDRKIDVHSFSVNNVINILTGKEPYSMLNAIGNLKNIVKYALKVSNYNYDNIIFSEMHRCMKEICYMRVLRYRNYIQQFQTMIESVKEYGNYPYPKFMVIPEKKLIYLEMPKVANCSIKASMLKREFKDDYSVQKESLKYTVHCLDHNYDDFYKFTFVRNPFERLVSCYESKYHKDRQMMGEVIEELEYNHYLFGLLRKDKGFTNFLCRIFFIPDPYKDHHFKPQYDIIYDKDGRCCVDFIGKYEEIDKEYQKISQCFDLDKLATYNKTERKSYMDYYNIITARIAYLIYKDDIRKFGYEKDYKKLIYYIKNKNI